MKAIKKERPVKKRPWFVLVHSDPEFVKALFLSELGITMK